jgi:peptide/nickel transport system permease protein
MTTTTPDTTGSQDVPETAAGQSESGWLRFLDNRAAVVSLILFVCLCLVAFAAPFLGLRDPINQFYGDEFVPPNAQYWFGTDDFGRDIFARCLFGMRLSLAIGLSAAATAGVVGTLLGLLQGYLRGWIDEILGRIWDTLLAFPGLLLGLAVAIFLGDGSQNAAVAAAIAGIPIIGRLARAATLGEQEKGYVMAVRAAGARTRRILTLHLFPNVFPIVMVQIALIVATAMILEAALSFLGIGAQPPHPSLGGMLRDARDYMWDAPWYAIFPGLTLTVLLLLITFISDGLADAFDPRRGARQGAP